MTGVLLVEEAKVERAAGPGGGAPRPTGLRRMAIALGLALAGVAVVAGIAGFSMLRGKPGWWMEFDASAPEVVELARRVENAVVTTVHKARPEDEPWGVGVDARQANAWLNAKMPGWMTSRGVEWPAQVDQVQAHFRDGRLTLGARIVKGGARQYVAASVVVQVRDDGSLWLVRPRARAGLLDLPSGWTIERLREWLPEDMHRSAPTQRVLSALEGKAPLFEQAVLKLEDGRRVRFLSIVPNRGALEVTAVTERKRPAGGEGEGGR